MSTPFAFRKGKSLFSQQYLATTRRSLLKSPASASKIGHFRDFTFQRNWLTPRKRALLASSNLIFSNEIRYGSRNHATSIGRPPATSLFLQSRASSNMASTPFESTNAMASSSSSSNVVNPSQPPILKEKITKVTTTDQARQVLTVLNAHPEVYWACDTEVADIDVKTVGPVGHGKVTCVSMFGGSEVDFGLGEGKGSVLWIENINDSAELLQMFKEWFENPKYKKVWHNYGFDRHVMFNEGIDCKGFAGDTMHMARLWDTSLDKIAGAGGYSLAALSSLLLAKEKQEQMQKLTKNGSQFSNSAPSAAYSSSPTDDETPGSAKESMLHLFGVAKLTKSGQPSKVKTLPSIWQLQTEPLHREKWIQYSAKDAVCTFDLHRKLAKYLSEMSWDVEGVQRVNGEDRIQVSQMGTMYDFYEKYLRKFGEVLTDMERIGIKVDVDGRLSRAEEQAKKDRDNMQQVFVEWMSRYVKDWKHVNIGSTAQMQQLFFGHYKQKLLQDKTRVFTMDKDAEMLEMECAEIEDQNKYASWTAVQIREELKSRGLKSSGKKSDLLQTLLQDDAGIGTQGGEKSNTNGTEETTFPQSEIDLKSVSDLHESYKSLSVEELQDICTSRHLNFHNIDPDSDLKSALRNLIERDMAQFKRQQQQGDAANAWPSTSYSTPSASSIKNSDASSGSKPNSNGNTEPPQVDNFAEIAQLRTPKRNLEFSIESFGMKPKEFTPAGVPKVGNNILRDLAGSGVYTASGEETDNVVYGSAYKHFGGGEDGKDACRAIGALANISQVETMISSFLLPLQALADSNGRIHCSLNLNTETGRLSSRKPNLQNQPALEKDQYKIRDAFVAEEGNTLLVADYGQLELRLMAHMTQCRSMLDAFTSGGCFHSRTAVGMYPHIQEAIAKGEVLLEWDYSKGAPPKPLVKDVYGSERRKAKTLNFSIAYGKTVHGLAKDWGISIEEATETLEAWYRDRPEVKKWQEETREMAKRDGYVRTMMGRRRALKEANTKGPAGGHALRAAINTPIQGSAADVVMMAMIQLSNSEELKRIGWKLLLQIHDEVILEGPRESKDEALAEVIRCMQNPFDGIGLKPLSVKLEVDAKTADTWYQAK